ncbi:MAG: AhpC/TSA family protein [Chitinophagales bacterium]|nr:AhpC/TSA family protein [Chitinophagales bacterium]
MVSANQFDKAVLNSMNTNTGVSLAAMSDKGRVLLVFLRHFGCTFCREALADIASQREEIEKEGNQLVFVHMTTADVAERYFTRYGLEGALHISDLDCEYYSHFGLTKGNFTQLFGLQSWIRGFSAGVIAGHGIGAQLGDGFQMPGVFVIHQGKILHSFIHKLASDRPDYLDLMKCCS